MTTVTKTFNYTGTLQQADIPAGTTSIDIYLWGGAGGGGSSDAGGPGGPGAAGHHVKKTGLAISSAQINTTLEVAVGGGGGGGSSSSTQSAAVAPSGPGFNGGSGGSGVCKIWVPRASYSNFSTSGLTTSTSALTYNSISGTLISITAHSGSSGTITFQ